MDLLTALLAESGSARQNVWVSSGDQCPYIGCIPQAKVAEFTKLLAPIEVSPFTARLPLDGCTVTAVDP